MLEAGIYEVSDPGLNIIDSGIVLRGRGQGDGIGDTKIVFTSTVSDSYAVTLGFSNGGLDNIEPGEVTYPVTDSYVPVGSKTLSITDASTYTVGDRIIVKLQPNDDWLLHSKYLYEGMWHFRIFGHSWQPLTKLHLFSYICCSVQYGSMGMDYK